MQVLNQPPALCARWARKWGYVGKRLAGVHPEALAACTVLRMKRSCLSHFLPYQSEEVAISLPFRGLASTKMAR